MSEYMENKSNRDSVLEIWLARMELEKMQKNH